jgi:hypothetical protein
MHTSHMTLAGAFLLCAMVGAVPANAQGLVIDGLYDCARATNNRTYCKQLSTRRYTPVSEEFFRRYLSIRDGAPPVGAPTVNQAQTNQEINNSNNTSNTTNINIIVQDLNSQSTDIAGQISLLSKIVEDQKALRSSGREAASSVDHTIAAVEARLTKLRADYSDKVKEASKYQTNIRPIDQDPYVTARRASEIYPKVPYYIPGTQETGEFWVEPQVSEEGNLLFKFRFIDTGSREDRTRSVIEMRPVELERAQRALLKLHEWSQIAHERKIRKDFQKRLDCFPNDNCPLEGQKIDGKASTEIIFKVNDDGSTNGRIQRNKGRFEEGYNISVESGLMLQAYLRYVLKEGRQEHESGSQTKEDLDKLFN